ncbi:MAG: Type 1 glutamine amidotransferase-like domain-containing protein [Clostridia bacterium]|nr:Type 1 glutamine amidotransferase-like domain-containing protein [Clostridia bacterium]
MSLYFLTSSPTGTLDGSRLPEKGFDEYNSFSEKIKANWKQNSRCIYIASDPATRQRLLEARDFFREAIYKEGLSCDCFDILDDYRRDITRVQLQSYDVIFLSGGHVPTQNRFFEEISLKEKITGFEGIIIGISAGTMNSADIVYAQPEEEGESLDPNFRRFLKGLGLTKIMILPHYQMEKDFYLDGKRLYEDITYPDSYGNLFIAIPDGSYLLIENGKETIYGEAYRIENGTKTQICSLGESITL